MMNRSQSRSTPGDGARPDDALTEAVAVFAATFDPQAIPTAVRQQVKLHLIDTLACAVAGRNIDISHSARAYAALTGAGGNCRVFGSAQRFSAVASAFANSVIANALDFDDGFEVDGKGMGHPGASLVPAALAALSSTGPTAPVTGTDFLAALVLGYEINNRLILAMQPSAARFAEVYGIAQHQAIGAALVFGRLTGFGTGAMRNAIGLAGALTPVPSLHKYNWTTRPIISLKDGVAPAAQAGVQAGLMTQAGFVGSTDLLDGPQGYWRMMGSDRFDETIVGGDLGSTWLALKGSFKLYPACRWIAPAIEAFETAFAGLAVPADDLATIEIITFSTVADKLMEPHPTNAIDAQFSLPYLIGVLASGRPAGEAWFAPDTLTDPLVRSIAARVSVTVDPDMDQLMRGQSRRPSAIARLTTIDGRSSHHHVAAPRGGEIRPVDTAAVVAKAQANLASLGDRAYGLIDRLLDLEQVPDVAAVLDPLF